MRTSIVVPTIREQSISHFLELWEPEFRGQRVIIVEDNPQKTFALPSWVEHYCWSDIDERLGDRAWIVPRRSDCVRSFGYYLAAQSNCDFILTLDDDCYPENPHELRAQAREFAGAPTEEGSGGGFLAGIEAALNRRWRDDRWWNTLDGPMLPRGYPYDIRERTVETVLHHGLWSNVPDLDGKTQLRFPEFRTRPARALKRVPHGKFFPMCGMNLAFRPFMVPALYFLLMGQDPAGKPWPYDRFGDIWAGLFAKKVADHLGFAVTSGAPSVHHSRASNPDVNLRKETPGYPVNELLWLRLARLTLTSETVAGCYLEVARKLNMEGDYWVTLRSAMTAWVSLVADLEAVRLKPDLVA